MQRTDGDGEKGKLVCTLATFGKQNSLGNLMCLCWRGLGKLLTSRPAWQNQNACHQCSLDFNFYFSSSHANTVPMISVFSGAVTSLSPQTRIFTHLAMYPVLFHFVPLPSGSSKILPYWSYRFSFWLQHQVP